MKNPTDDQENPADAAQDREYVVYWPTWRLGIGLRRRSAVKGHKSPPSTRRTCPRRGRPVGRDQHRPPRERILAPAS